MSTETQTVQAEAPVTTTGSDEFTAEERAYFESRGETGLPVAPAVDAPTPAPAAEKPAAPSAEGDDPDGTISIDESGMHRDKRTGRFVPHGAFHKEREGRKAAETRASEQAIELARAKERLDILAKALEGGDVAKPAQTAPAKDDDPEPDIETDFVAHAKWQAREIARMRKALAESQSSVTAKLSEVEMGNAYRSDAIAFMREQADFRDAYNHLVSVLDAELTHRGLDDPAKRLAEIARLEREEVAFASKRGVRPAQHIYKLAELRGWKAPAAKTDAAAASAQLSDEVKIASSAAAEELARLEKGQNAARSLSSAGGSAPAPLTGEAIASMSEAEFDALLRKSGPNHNAALRKLLGG